MHTDEASKGQGWLQIWTDSLLSNLAMKQPHGRHKQQMVDTNFLASHMIMAV